MRARLPQNVSRGTLLLGAAIAVAFIAVAVNVPPSVQDHDLRERSKVAFLRWSAANGTRRAYGVAVIETHKHFDMVCAVHFPDLQHRHRADYRIRLLVTHGKGAHVFRAVKGPLKVVPTATGTKCGAPPPPP